MDEAGENYPFPELPTASAVYHETKRHWFWVSYTLVQEGDQWRIQFMTDEAAEALNLPTQELDNKINEHDQAITEVTRKHRPQDADALIYAEEIMRHLLQSGSYIDALLARSYDDLELYIAAAERMQLYGFTERSLAYLEQVVERFEQHRAVVLRSMAGLQRIRSQYYEDIDDIKRADRFLKLAETSLQQSLAIEDRFETHISMAEVLIDRNENNDLDEARKHLLQAKDMLPPDSPADEAHIEMHLGEIAAEQGRAQESLEHHLRAAELEPDLASSWTDVAYAHKSLGNFEDADAAFRRALALEPDNGDLIWNLGELYLDEKRDDEAIQIFEDALEKNPTSADLNVFLASASLESGDARQSEIFLDKAEKLAPNHIAVPSLRNALETFKKDRSLLGKRTSKKARRRHR